MNTTYNTATARDQRARLNLTDAQLVDARGGEHGPAGVYAAAEFQSALRTVERRSAAADARLREITTSATAELESAQVGQRRHGDRFGSVVQGYAADCAAIDRAIEVIEHCGRVLSGLFGVAFDGHLLEEMF